MTMGREEAILHIEKTKEFLTSPKICWSKHDDKITALNMAIEALQEVQKHEETFEWCHDCKEYDTENYCCHRWSKVIRNTVEEQKNVEVVVRCKDCKHWHSNTEFCGIWSFQNQE